MVYNFEGVIREITVSQKCPHPNLFCECVTLHGKIIADMIKVEDFEMGRLS